jgi:AcrR family transcriptional regulator
MARRSTARERLSGPQRRQRILDAAAEAFAAHGYRAASVEDIARAAGVTKPVLYDHFASKRELFTSLMESARDELTALGAQAMHAEAPPAARIRAAVDAFFAYVEHQPAQARVLLLAARGEPELRDAFHAVQEEATARIASLLAAEPQLRDAPDLLLLAEFVKCGMHGLAEWWEQHPATPRDTLVDAVMDATWTGVRSRYLA